MQMPIRNSKVGSRTGRLVADLVGVSLIVALWPIAGAILTVDRLLGRRSRGTSSPASDFRVAKSRRGTGGRHAPFVRHSGAARALLFFLLSALGPWP